MFRWTISSILLLCTMDFFKLNIFFIFKIWITSLRLLWFNFWWLWGMKIIQGDISFIYKKLSKYGIYIFINFWNFFIFYYIKDFFYIIFNLTIFFYIIFNLTILINYFYFMLNNIIIKIWLIKKIISVKKNFHNIKTINNLNEYW